MTDAERSSSHSEAEVAFSRFLDQVSAGEHADFDTFCEEHLHIERELRALHEQWRLFQPHANALTPGGDRLEPELERLVAKLRARRSGAASRYSLHGEVARGGMGVILRVQDDELERDLAMKVVLGSAEVAPTGETPPVPAKRLARFLREAKITAKLDHPGIVPVHEMGLDAEGRVFFTMKLVEGRTLQDVIGLAHRGEEGWTQVRVLEVLLRVCDAIAFAHSKGVIHRDLKPANVMVGAFGQVYLMDWGLARVVEEADENDLRIRGGTLNVLDPAAPLQTMDGDVVGTPSFMSPEQARGEIEKLGPLSDVYSVGAMLYAIIAGHAPYQDPGRSSNNYAILERVRSAPPKALDSTSGVPAELLSICEKAMAREPKDRYASMETLAEDLRAYLEGRVVRAYEAGAWAEARKWVRRNKPLAASLAAAVMLLVGGLATAIVLRQQAVDNEIKAKRQEGIAKDNAAEAQKQATIAQENFEDARRQERIAKKRAEDILSLSAFQKLEDLTKEAEKLWPPWPKHLDAYDRWLAEAEKLVAGLEPSADGQDAGHRARLAALRERAVPWPDEEREAARRTHPRFAELAPLRAKLDALRRAQAVRDGEAEPAAFALDLSASTAKAGELNGRAWPLVDPERTEFGREAEGLALATLAWERAEDDGERASIGDTLAWAFFADGQDEEALATSAAALDAAPDERREELERYLETMRAAVAAAKSGKALLDLELKVAALETEVSERREWVFEDEQDRWWHGQLVNLVNEIEEFANSDTGLLDGTSPEHGWGIQRRREWAASVEERTTNGEEAAAKWAACLERIAANERYAGLELEPQLGLVPLGRDLDSGLEEFGHPLTGSVPVRGEDGKLVLADDFGLVFVLIPAGTFAMGAQSTDATGPNYDPQARADEPVHDVKLSAFFLSKYEMTQSQWRRFTEQTPSYYRPPGNVAGRQLGQRDPVEQVSWINCEQVTRHMGLSLPSEAQWEYAARAGTTTPWWPGEQAELLKDAANVADAYAKQASPDWPCEAWNDGHVIHAPVGSFRANAFGLHDVHGNVWEWCLDGHQSYRREAQTDPVNDPTGARVRVLRGGSFNNIASFARAAYRNSPSSDLADLTVGCRPARVICYSFTSSRPPSGR